MPLTAQYCGKTPSRGIRPQPNMIQMKTAPSTVFSPASSIRFDPTEYESSCETEEDLPPPSPSNQRKSAKPPLHDRENKKSTKKRLRREEQKKRNAEIKDMLERNLKKLKKELISAITNVTTEREEIDENLVINKLPVPDADGKVLS